MNAKLIIFLTFTFAFILDVNAGSATWKLNPTTGDWNTAANWNPPTVPNQPTDIATFDVSNTAQISISFAQSGECANGKHWKHITRDAVCFFQQSAQFIDAENIWRTINQLRLCRA